MTGYASISDTARLLSLSRQTLYSWIAKGSLTTYQDNGHTVLRLAQVRRVMGQRGHISSRTPPEGFEIVIPNSPR